jgi:hypothetical protein
MPEWTDNDLQRQFHQISGNGWLASFRQAANDYRFPVEVLLGIASRETNMQNIVGNGGHGYGIMQIDDRSFPDWCHSGAWRDAGAGIRTGALVLDARREQVRSGQGKALNVGGTPFIGTAVPDDELLRIAVAAYNSGLWAYCSFSEGRDPDTRTTQGDYSADTLKRASYFRGLLGAA